MCKTAECLYSIIPQIIIVSSHTRGKNSNLAKKTMEKSNTANQVLP
jgi:hypothetical protein